MFWKDFLRKVLLFTWIGLLGAAASSPGSTFSLDPEIRSTEGSTYWRWIGVRAEGTESGTCAMPSCLGNGWSTRPLFDSALSDVYSELDRFCVWEYDGSAGSLQDSPDLVCLDSVDGSFEHTQPQVIHHGGLEFKDVEPDLLGVVPLDLTVRPKSDSIDSLEMELESNLLDQVGHISSLPVCSQKPPTVRLTLLDTSPTDARPTSVETSPHGKSLRLLAQKLLCNVQLGRSPSDCIAEIRTRLVLAYKDSSLMESKQAGRNEGEGGYSGLVGELGEGIVAELDDWILQGPAAEDRLVMNLSVAWDRLYGGTSDVHQMPPSAQAVYRALEVAACEGAVVLAAAGNLRDYHPGNDSEKPLMPGAWAERSSSACDSVPPLLRAVGAFGATRRPISNALAQGIPEFAAYGDHAVLATGLIDHTPPLTGSSVATLIVSVAAAAVAYYAPTLSAANLMQMVHDSGELIPSGTREADFCTPSGGNGCPSISYVSICESVRKACQDNCPVSLPTCPSRPNAWLNFSVVDLSPHTNTQNVSSFTPCSVPDCLETCDDDLPRLDQDPQNNEVCPRRQHHSASRTPGTKPQPEVGLCPNCSYDRTTGNFYGIAELGPREKATEPTLHLSCPSGDFSFGIPTALDNSLNTSPFPIPFSLKNLPTSCDAATISYGFSSHSKFRGSTTMPVLIGKS